jgi:hypothetical protein
MEAEHTVTVREAVPADACAIARVHVDSWRTTYRGIVPDSVLSQLSYEEREPMWQGILDAAEGQAFVYVAVDESGQIVGFASGGPERSGDPDYKGELYAIYIADAYIARAWDDCWPRQWPSGSPAPACTPCSCGSWRTTPRAISTKPSVASRRVDSRSRSVGSPWTRLAAGGRIPASWHAANVSLVYVK